MAHCGRRERTILRKHDVASSILFEKVPIVLASFVTVDSGTGCVHMAPAHGPDDYVVGQKYQLPLNNPVLANGCYGPDVVLFAGLNVLKANPVVLDTLKQQGSLLFETTIEHSYPHCWRHKTPMIFRATPQWFIVMEGVLRQSILKGINEVKWVPDWGKQRIHSMVEGRPDWCISRQRAWVRQFLFLSISKRANRTLIQFIF